MLRFPKIGVYVDEPEASGDPNGGDGAGAADGNGAGGGGGEGDPKLLQFTQAQLDTLISRRIGEVKTKTEKDVKASIPAPVQKLMEALEADESLLGSIEDMLSGKAKKKDDDTIPRAQVDDMLRRKLTPVEQERDALKEQVANLLEVKVLGDLKTAIDKAGALAGAHDQVAMLLRPFIQYDAEANTYSVVNDQGNVYFDPDTSQPYEPVAFVKRWLADNPHFLPASARSGSGARGGVGGGRVGKGDTLDDLNEAHALAMKEGRKMDAQRIEVQRAEIRRQQLLGVGAS